VTRTRYAECDRYGCAPEAVVRYKDRDEVAALMRLYYRDINGMPVDADGGLVSDKQAALREFANPKPPNPEEPTGLGAVVEDAEGVDWHRTRVGRWIAEDGLCSRGAGWGHIDVVRVLGEGVIA
jgi:hypothetical protein